jgi:PAS domain S-box-containing protein
MTGSLIGFYHFVDSDQKTIFLESQPEPSTEAVPQAAGSDNPYSMDQAQVWTDWVSAMKPIVHNDYMGTPNSTGLPAGHSPVRRELVVPILRAGNVVALLGVANKPDDYTDEDVALLNYFADVAWEVAERKQAEENLIQSHDLLENLARLVPGVIYQYRLYPDGRSAFPYSSPGMFQIYGVTPEEVREDATPVFGRLHPDDAQRVSDTISESARTLQTFFCEFRVVLPELGLRWRWSQAHPERMPDGGTLWHGIISDITEQKQAEAELRQHRDHLEELVEERTTQLVVAKEQAEMANRAKSDFLAVMSHEIRTPLNGVLGLAHLLFQTGLNEKQRNYLANLQVSGEILLATINDILDFSKIESGKLNLELTNFNLDEVLTKLSTNVAYRAQAKNLELVFNIAADVPHQLVGDPMRLGQVLLNLVGNAIKFTSAGDVVIKTSLLRKTSDNVVLEFLVRDTGIGMSAETIGHLFEPFTQADNSTSRKYGGTGLGLTISQRLVQLMRGNITAESQLGKGSVFKFSLQLGYVPGNGIGSQLSAKRVLVVDDNPETLESLESALESFAMQVTVAQSAEIGLELLTQAVPQPVELVLMEWNLAGGLNGLEAIQRMRRDPEQRHIPAILLISAEEMVPPAEDGELDGYLVKPITHSQLYDALVQVLRPDKSQAIRPQAQLISQEAMEKLEGGRILLVEDNQINQLVARDLLESMGLQVFIADNGEQAVEMVKIGHYDVVLMDIQMPGMDGYEATALIRQDQRGEDNRLPIIAMTAHALESDRQKTLDAGLDDYISKPVDVTKLANVLIRWVHAGPGNVEPKPVTVNQISDAAGVRYRVSPELTREVAPQPVTDELPESLAFFDLKSALARLGGNKELYLRLLQLFYADHAQDGQTIQTALTRTDMNYARLLAHSLKGVASVIGATELSVAASVLEMAIVRENAFFYDEFMLQLGLRLADVIHSIETLTRPTQSSGESES